METTITITSATRNRLAALQAAMRAENGGRSVTADAALNRALDRSEELGRILAGLATGKLPELARALTGRSDL